MKEKDLETVNFLAKHNRASFILKLYKKGCL